MSGLVRKLWVDSLTRVARAPTFVPQLNLYEYMKIPFTLILLFLAMASRVTAQSIVVEATAIDEERIEPSRTSSVIGSAEIQKKNPQTVADVLRNIPGFEVIRQGTFGQTTTLLIRGARSEDTLVLIDGTEANEAMSPASGYDFSSLSPENILRIEIYRGPQSVKFGAGALGGVINIVTRDGAVPSNWYSLETGRYSFTRYALGSAGKSGRIGYSLAADSLSTDGFSAASKRLGNQEDDGADLQSLSSKISWRPNNISVLEATARYSHADVDIDYAGGSGGDDPNASTETRVLVTGVTGSRRFFDERLKTSLGLYFTETERDGLNLADPGRATTSTDHFLSENKKVQSDSEMAIGESHTLRLNLQWREESGRAVSVFNGATSGVGRQDQSVTGESLTYLFEGEHWFYDVGARLDQSSSVGQVVSQRASVGHQSKALRAKFFVSYGTGFKLPSLYQLYSIYGDKELGEENSQTLEFTYEQKLSSEGQIHFTVFENRYDDLIDFNLVTNKYFNISDARTRGVEVEGSLRFAPEFTLDANYTYLDAQDMTTRRSLLRRPFNSWSTTLNYEHEKFTAFTEVRFKGKRFDVDASTFQKNRTDAYELVSIGGAYSFSRLLKFNARLENLFDVNYEEVSGYGTPGISYFVGLTGEI